MPLFDPTPTNIALAAARLKDDKLVAFPTETVYGLGANALNTEAVERIYTTKGRPSYNPLIVHVASVEDAQQLAAHWPENAQKLAQAFWPGPLTLVVPKTSEVPDIISAGLETVALRVPAHPIALELLRAAQIPLAAPSANRSGEVSPSRAEHVTQSLGDDIWVLDGGPCEVGIESTVVDVSGDGVAILRPGILSSRQIERVVGPLVEASDDAEGVPRRSPGTLEKHYAPRALVHLYSTIIDAAFHAPLLASGQKIGVLPSEPTTLGRQFDVIERVMPAEPAAYAREIYGALRDLDDAGVALILVEDVPGGSAWEGIRDRLKRAAKR
ncbi:threonylcarbamoyl-AMP synthase [Abditibacteriota bacterium]|nr:threonylcarbamoyl-AMP synthase [Abditibacteriota bacterium]